MSYVYVGNVDVNVTSADLHLYLQNKFPQHNFSVDDLPKRESAKSRAFKVTVNADLFTTLMKEDVWPTGIRVKKFHFLRIRDPPNGDVKTPVSRKN